MDNGLGFNRSQPRIVQSHEISRIHT
jgi:hypothetical protein